MSTQMYLLSCFPSSDDSTSSAKDGGAVSLFDTYYIVTNMGLLNHSSKHTAQSTTVNCKILVCSLSQEAWSNNKHFFWCFYPTNATGYSLFCFKGLNSHYIVTDSIAK